MKEITGYGQNRYEYKKHDTGPQHIYLSIPNNHFQICMLIYLKLGYLCIPVSSLKLKIYHNNMDNLLFEVYVHDDGIHGHPYQQSLLDNQI